MKPIVLDLFGGTGAWSRPWLDSGDYDVLIVDTLSWIDYEQIGLTHGKEVSPARRWVGDIRYYANRPTRSRDVTLVPGDVYAVLCALPCTDFAGSGAQYWNAKDRDGRTNASLELLHAAQRIIAAVKPSVWAIENPVGRLPRWLGPPKAYFHPSDYGDAYTKKTCLWGRFALPPKNPVPAIRTTSQGSHIQKYGGKSLKTKIMRSITPAGFAKAFFEANRKEK